MTTCHLEKEGSTLQRVNEGELVIMATSPQVGQDGKSGLEFSFFQDSYTDKLHQVRLWLILLRADLVKKNRMLW